MKPAYGLLTGVMVIVAVAALLGVIGEKGLFSAETASWVQGLGTIAAILASAWIATLPLEAEARKRREARIELVNTITDTVDVVTTEIHPICAALKGHDAQAAAAAWKTWKTAPATLMLDPLLAMPIREWPDPMLFRRVVALGSAISRVANSDPEGRMQFGQPSQDDYDRLIPHVLELEARETEYRNSLAGLRAG